MLEGRKQNQEGKKESFGQGIIIKGKGKKEKGWGKHATKGVSRDERKRIVGVV